MKLRSTYTRMTGRKKYAEGLEQLMTQSMKLHLPCMASSDTGALVFIDDVTQEAAG